MQSKIYLIKTLKAGRQSTAWRHIMKVDKSNNFLQQSTCWTKLISKLQEKVVIFLGVGHIEAKARTVLFMKQRLELKRHPELITETQGGF